MRGFLLSVFLIYFCIVSAFVVVKGPPDIPKTDLKVIATKFMKPLEEIKRLTNNQVDIELVIEPLNVSLPHRRMWNPRVLPSTKAHKFIDKQELEETLKKILNKYKYNALSNGLEGAELKSGDQRGSPKNIMSMLQKVFKGAQIRKQPPRSSQDNMNWIEVKVPKENI